MAPRKDDEFLNVWVDGEQEGFYRSWIKQSSAKHSWPSSAGAEILRKQYPDHSLLLTNDYGFNIHAFPAAQATPMEDIPLIANMFYLSLGNSGPIPGILLESVEVGGFNVTWEGYEFLMFTVKHPLGLGTITQHYLLHKGPEANIRSLLMSAGNWASKLHNEIWVFDQGYWRKDAGLWYELQKADWKDVILKEDFKKSLQKDVYGFFDSEELYKDLGIPWKRGLIMHGPPGNGKTISLKVIMKTCDAKGYAPLYVKSFQSYLGDEYSMQMVFNKARQLAPCVVVLEDLDSLITDRNRSFFLNQLDGLEGNDGLLVVGTTNHFDRLDPGLSTRPSRLFDDPDRDERALYAQYWQRKLADKNTVDFPDSLVNKIAAATSKFSFAYLKEAFVSSLVILAGIEGDEETSFESVIMDQIEKLRKQLGKTSINRHVVGRPLPAVLSHSAAVDPADSGRDYRQALHSLIGGDSQQAHRQRIFTNLASPAPSAYGNGDPHTTHHQEAERRFRFLFDQMNLQNGTTDQRYLY
ncbi:hypothetical protein AAF712_005327 [Marasmius tenuissimus]|uniref:ATPase AAA-type core domain-containing protein n=1 Tax=Marasmius tenuissimus TaxID=585030 RepID=A0ABR3A2M3_9AGAR